MSSWLTDKLSHPDWNEEKYEGLNMHNASRLSIGGTSWINITEFKVLLITEARMEKTQKQWVCSLLHPSLSECVFCTGKDRHIVLQLSVWASSQKTTSDVHMANVSQTGSDPNRISHSIETGAWSGLISNLSLCAGEGLADGLPGYITPAQTCWGGQISHIYLM